MPTTSTSAHGGLRAWAGLPLGTSAVLVPVKSFGEAKRRLEPTLSTAQRRELARTMAEAVLRASAPLAVAVVCDDIEVAAWARSHGALVVWEPGRGLNGAVDAGIERMAAVGVRQVTVAHADLPRAEGIGTMAPFAGITLVPDHRRDGTTVIRIPTGCGFRFSYGPGSFERHLAEAHRLGLAVRVLDAPALAFDVDLPEDLERA